MASEKLELYASVAAMPKSLIDSAKPIASADQMAGASIGTMSSTTPDGPMIACVTNGRSSPSRYITASQATGKPIASPSAAAAALTHSEFVMATAVAPVQALAR